MSARTPAEILREAKRLIEEKGWCQGADAIDRRGRPVLARSGDAASFCIAGALFAASFAEHGEEQAIKLFRHCIPETLSLAQWNDEPLRTPEQVLAAFDRAIALAEADRP